MAGAAHRTGRRAPPPISTVLLGAVLGVLVSLTSVGAGALGMTALLILYPTLPINRLVGSDIAHAVPLTLLAGIGHWLLGSVDVALLVSLLIGSIPGIIVGSLIATPRVRPRPGLRPRDRTGAGRRETDLLTCAPASPFRRASASAMPRSTGRGRLQLALSRICRCRGDRVLGMDRDRGGARRGLDRDRVPCPPCRDRLSEAVRAGRHDPPLCGSPGRHDQHAQRFEMVHERRPARCTARSIW